MKRKSDESEVMGRCSLLFEFLILSFFYPGSCVSKSSFWTNESWIALKYIVLIVMSVLRYYGDERQDAAVQTSYRTAGISQFKRFAAGGM